MGMPAARLNDATAHGDPLKPGPCSSNVFIGGQPAWRALSPAMAQRLMEIFKETAENATKALAVANTPAQAKPMEDMAAGVDEMIDIMASTDQHDCTVIKVIIPDGKGVVINGSTSVMINGLPACRVGDTIMETTSINSITEGEATVVIGSGPSAPMDPGVVASMAMMKAAEIAAKQKEEAEKAEEE